MIYTTQAIKLFEIFHFNGFLNFSTHSKIEQAKKDQQKQGEQQNLLKETYDNM